MKKNISNNNNNQSAVVEHVVVLIHVLFKNSGTVPQHFEFIYL